MLTLQQKQFKLVFRGVAMVVAGVLRTSPANGRPQVSVFNKECPALTLGRMIGLVLVGTKVTTNGRRVTVKPGSTRMIPEGVRQ